MGLRVVIAGGGTGGHLYPGIAVARELRARRPDATVSFAGTARGIETRVVPREGFALDLIRSAGLKGKTLLDRLRGASLLPAGLIDSWRIVSPSAARDRRRRVQRGSGGAGGGRARRADDAVGAERGSRIDQSAAGAMGARRGCDVRLDAGVFRRQGFRQRQPGAAGVSRDGWTPTGMGER